MSEKFVSAGHHKDELFRDSSTFEFNFSKKGDWALRNNIDAINNGITEANTALAVMQLHDENRSRYLLSEEQLKVVFELGMQLR